MESGNPFTYMFKARGWAADYLVTVGVLFGSYIFAFVILATVILPSFAPFLSSQPPTSPSELPQPFANPFLAFPGVVLAYLPGLVLGSILGGYFLRVIANIIHGSATPVRGWFSDFGPLLLHGFLITVIYYIWYIPGQIFVAIAGTGYTYSPSSSGQFANFSFTPVYVIFTALTVVWGLFLALVFPVVVARYADGYRFRSAFQIGRILRIFGHSAGEYILVFLIAIAAGIIALLGFVGICIGILFTMIYASYVIAGAWGFAYRDALTKMGLQVALQEKYVPTPVMVLEGPEKVKPSHQLLASLSGTWGKVGRVSIPAPGLSAEVYDDAIAVSAGPIGTQTLSPGHVNWIAYQRKGAERGVKITHTSKAMDSPTFIGDVEEESPFGQALNKLVGSANVV